jgi:hypothetical protein
MRRLTAIGSVTTVAAIVLAMPATAQWEDPPSKCGGNPVRQAYGRGSQDNVKTWAPGIGLRVYDVSVSASVEKCNGASQVLYHVSWDASALSDDQTIFIQGASRRTDDRWQQACVKRYDNGKQVCIFQLEGGTKGPRFGAPGWEQMRTTKGRSYITTIKLKHGVLTDSGTGSFVSNWPHTITVKLHQYPYCRGKPGQEVCYDRR